MNLKKVGGMSAAMVCALLSLSSSAFADSVSATATMQVTSVYAMKGNAGTGQSQLRSVNVNTKSVVDGKELSDEFGPANQALSLAERIALDLDAEGKGQMTIENSQQGTKQVVQVTQVESGPGQKSLRISQEDVTKVYAPVHAGALDSFLAVMIKGLKGEAADVKITRNVETSSMICVETINQTLTCSYTAVVSFKAQK